MAKYFSKETRRKISESKKGKPRSEETKKKISLALNGKMRGSNHPMWGKHHSEESRRKISLARMRKCIGSDNPNYHKNFSAETRLKMSLAHLGKPLSKEHKKNLSKAARKNKIAVANLRKMAIVHRGIPLSSEIKTHMSIVKLREKNPAWKGGRIKDGKGYIRILIPNHPNAYRDGYILEHRGIMERRLNRNLDSKEIVHHINGIRADNRIENLNLYPSRAEHTKQHAHLNRTNILGESPIIKPEKKDEKP